MRLLRVILAFIVPLIAGAAVLVILGRQAAADIDLEWLADFWFAAVLFCAADTAGRLYGTRPLTAGIIVGLSGGAVFTALFCLLYPGLGEMKLVMAIFGISVLLATAAAFWGAMRVRAGKLRRKNTEEEG